MNPRNFFVALLVLSVAVGLFFMPEISKIFSKKSNNTVAVKGTSTEEKEDSSTRASMSSKGTGNPIVPLDKVLERIDSGAYDKTNLKDSSANQSIPKGLSPEGVVRVKEQQAAQKVLSAAPISWDTLSKEQISAVVKRAEIDSSLFLKVLNQSRYPKSRLALINYINGLRTFQEGSLRRVSPKEALTLLGDLDLEVTRTLTNEGVTRGTYKLWNGISLGPLVVGSQADIVKGKMMPPFRAEIVLTDVRIREPQVSESVKSLKSSNRNVPKKSLIQVKGVLKGDGIDRLEIFRNGELINSKKVSKGRSPEELRKFDFNYAGINGAQGIFSVRTVSNEGLKFTKSYRFIPNVRRFARNNGQYVLQPVYYDSDLPVSRRLDRLFTVSANSTQGGGFTSLNEAVSGEFSKF